MMAYMGMWVINVLIAFIVLGTVFFGGCAAPTYEQKWRMSYTRACVEQVVRVDGACPISMAQMCNHVRNACRRQAIQEYARRHPSI